MGSFRLLFSFLGEKDDGSQGLGRGKGRGGNAEKGKGKARFAFFLTLLFWIRNGAKQRRKRSGGHRGRGKRTTRHGAPEIRARRFEDKSKALREEARGAAGISTRQKRCRNVSKSTSFLVVFSLSAHRTRTHKTISSIVSGG